ncbi:MAG: GntR family transcriptional regulator [Bacteroidetes bacterium]|nr:GntR family transcriptional regulator [Bacteroidota bacterium]
MEFQAQTAIWLQIARQVATRIMAGEWPPGERIPSVRELAAELQVNPNTVVRSVTFLQDAGIIVNQRGIGYFVADDGVSKARDMRKKAFTEELLPPFFKTIDELGIQWDELKTWYQQHQNNSKS